MKVITPRFFRVCARRMAESPAASGSDTIFNDFDKFPGANCAVSPAGSFHINFS
jgi:hypothetical protein